MHYSKMLMLFGLCMGIRAMPILPPVPPSSPASEKTRKLTESLRQAQEALKNVKNNIKQRFVRMHKKTPQELDIVRAWLKDVKLDDKTRAEVELAIKNGVDKLFVTLNKELDLELEQFEPQLEQWFTLDANSPGTILKSVANLLQEFIASTIPAPMAHPGAGFPMPSPMPGPQSMGAMPGGTSQQMAGTHPGPQPMSAMPGMPSGATQQTTGVHLGLHS